MSLRAHLETEPTLEERRSSPRRKLRLEAEGVSASVDQTPVVIHDLSEDGLLIESTVALAEGELIEVIIPQAGTAQAEVAWSSGGRLFGCKFKKQLSTAAVSSALLRSPTPVPENASAEVVEEARIELEALHFAIKRITRVVDRAIDQLTKKRD